MLIVVGNEKGGCGKTTIAVTLAAMVSRGGGDVLLVDADPRQQSSMRWAARRGQEQPEMPPVTCVSAVGANIRPQLKDLAKRYDVVVVDTGAEDSPELRAAVLVADVLVVPVQLDPLDLWALPTMEMLYTRAIMDNQALRLVIAANRVPYQSAASAEGDLRGWIDENVPGLPSSRVIVMTGRAAYGRASGEGLCVVEPSRRDARAADEAERLYLAVLEP